jgi:hypothetical protein
MPITFIKWDAGNLVVNSRMKDSIAVARNVTTSQIEYKQKTKKTTKPHSKR